VRDGWVMSLLPQVLPVSASPGGLFWAERRVLGS
jgi:hypothetical protein